MLRTDPIFIAAAATVPREVSDRHLVVGSGGSRTLTMSAGALLALENVGLRHWSSAGGVSGGAIVALLIAAGYSGAYLVRTVIDLDFETLLEKSSSAGVLRALLLKEYYAWKLPETGALKTKKLGDYLEALVPTWPANFWTIAVNKSGYILFLPDGVYSFSKESNTTVRLSSQPAPVSLALRATCTVPGLMQPLLYNSVPLYDGYLSEYGACPVQIPMLVNRAEQSQIFALDSGEEPSLLAGLSKLFWSTIFGGFRWLKTKLADAGYQPAVNLIKPELQKLPGLKFKLSKEEKWQAVMSGFCAAVQMLTERKLVPSEQLHSVGCVCADYAKLDAKAANFSEAVEAILNQHGVFAGASTISFPNSPV